MLQTAAKVPLLHQSPPQAVRAVAEVVYKAALAVAENPQAAKVDTEVAWVVRQEAALVVDPWMVRGWAASPCSRC